MSLPAAPGSTPSLLAGVLARDPRATARAISLVEAGGPAASDLLAALHEHTGHALLVGITGPPGAGKSTLVARLLEAFRRANNRVAVIAVDPSSPFSGGAILGDRVRMQAHAEDAGVFIRSMATRGQLGGLARATVDVSVVLDAAGFDVILIETVGVGQDEVDIARVADVCVLVTVPGAGDDVQAMKAGVMEIADIFVVNKADHDGVDRAVSALEQMLSLGSPSATRPPIVRVVATTGDGVDALVNAIEAAGVAMEPARAAQRAEWRLRELIARSALDRIEHEVLGPEGWLAVIASIEARRADPHTTAETLVGRLGTTGVLDHVGIATDAVDETIGFLSQVLGLRIGASEDVPAQGVRVRFAETGDARLEIVEASDETSAFASSLRRRGPGLHHLAFRVPDLDATLARLVAQGVRVIDRTPRPGAHGTRVAFIHPSSTRGVLVELVEKGSAPHASR